MIIKQLDIVFKGLVHWTEKMTETGLDATGPSVAVAHFCGNFGCQLAYFKKLSKPVSNQLQPVATGFFSI